MSLANLMARLEENRKRSAVKPKEVEVRVYDEVVALPNSSESVRPIPNVILRSALFGAIAKVRRPYLERVKVDSLGGIDMIYTGALLDQGDLDVWGRSCTWR